MEKYLRKDDVVAELARRRGDQTLQDFAAVVGVSYQLLAKVLNGEQDPGPKILQYLGLESIKLYERTT